MYKDKEPRRTNHNSSFHRPKYWAIGIQLGEDHFVAAPANAKCHGDRFTVSSECAVNSVFMRKIFSFLPEQVIMSMEGQRYAKKVNEIDVTSPGNSNVPGRAIEGVCFLIQQGICMLLLLDEIT
ncbi:hypothetical protein ACOSQ3_019463 [Xanthoceras sorbifolium]